MTAGGPPALAPLLAQLERARALGFLGPGPVRAHVDHADRFLRALEDTTGRVVDLGSGGGVPGLVLAQARPDLVVVLLDATARRCRFLEEAVAALDLRAEVVEGRAEEVGRGPWRGSADAVVARSFGSPSATAECAAPFLVRGGRLVVSEPPEPDLDRWDPRGLRQLGLAPVPGPPGVQVLEQVEPCPSTFPRRVGQPSKRPLF